MSSFFCSFFHEREREKNKNIGFHKKLGYRKKRETTLRHFVFSSFFWGGIFDDEEKLKKPKKKKNIYIYIEREKELPLLLLCSHRARCF